MTSSQGNKPIVSLGLPEDNNLLAIQNLLEEVSGGVVFDVNGLVEDLGYRGISHLLGDIECSLILDLGSNNYSGFSLDGLRKISSYGTIASKLEFLTIPGNIGGGNIFQFISEKNALGIKAKVFAVVGLRSNDKHGILKMVSDALSSGVDGIICPGEYANIVREVFGKKYNFEIVVGGDIKPKDAIKSGANHVILGNVGVESEEVKTALTGFNSEISGILPEITGKHEFEELLYTGKRLDLLKYIGAIYQRPEGGAFCKMGEGIYADGYINIGATDSNHYVLKRAGEELADKLMKSGIRGDLVVGTQVGSIRLSSYFAFEAGFGESIYLEKGEAHCVSFASFREVILSNKSDEEKEKELRKTFDRLVKTDIKLIKHGGTSLKGKKIILNEYIIIPGLLDNLVNFVRESGGEVVAVTCIGNMAGKTQIEGIPILSCFKPPAFGFYTDSDDVKTLPGRKFKPLPKDALISFSPKSDWKWLVDSMKKSKRD